VSRAAHVGNGDEAKVVRRWGWATAAACLTEGAAAPSRRGRSGRSCRSSCGAVHRSASGSPAPFWVQCVEPPLVERVDHIAHVVLADLQQRGDVADGLALAGHHHHDHPPQPDRVLRRLGDLLQRGPRPSTAAARTPSACEPHPPPHLTCGQPDGDNPARSITGVNVAGRATCKLVRSVGQTCCDKGLQHGRRGRRRLHSETSPNRFSSSVRTCAFGTRSSDTS
jgi:hypothetical protein